MPFKQIKAILDWKETEFLPLAKALEVALVGGVAETIMDAAETERRQRLYEYEQAKRFASHLELKLVA